MYDKKGVLLQNIVGAKYIVCTHLLNIVGTTAPTSLMVLTPNAPVSTYKHMYFQSSVCRTDHSVTSLHNWHLCTFRAFCSSAFLNCASYELHHMLPMIGYAHCTVRYIGEDGVNWPLFFRKRCVSKLKTHFLHPLNAGRCGYHFTFLGCKLKIMR